MRKEYDFSKGTRGKHVENAFTLLMRSALTTDPAWLPRLNKSMRAI
jgi:hypothetical protein